VARALTKLSKDNLSHLYQHPLYASFHYSHPPVLQRVREMEKIGNAGGLPHNARLFKLNVIGNICKLILNM